MSERNELKPCPAWPAPVTVEQALAAVIRWKLYQGRKGDGDIMHRFLAQQEGE